MKTSLLISSLLLAISPAFAHPIFFNESTIDPDKPITISGTLNDMNVTLSVDGDRLTVNQGAPALLTVEDGKLMVGDDGVIKITGDVHWDLVANVKDATDGWSVIDDQLALDGIVVDISVCDDNDGGHFIELGTGCVRLTNVTLDNYEGVPEEEVPREEKHLSSGKGYNATTLEPVTVTEIETIITDVVVTVTTCSPGSDCIAYATVYEDTETTTTLTTHYVVTTYINGSWKTVSVPVVETSVRAPSKSKAQVSKSTSVAKPTSAAKPTSVAKPASSKAPAAVSIPTAPPATVSVPDKAAASVSAPASVPVPTSTPTSNPDQFLVPSALLNGGTSVQSASLGAFVAALLFCLV
ncbi:hypothetical protein Cantr_10043 [Candida viswanathii]|uniref:Uncharacterized protein n=1 Tax=Candida viswanathii TaxID=5486 RepID=A0A367YBP2_9ASCO|nr:hypothetical protein Cantr_10043 [Candida viswanathii]